MGGGQNILGSFFPSIVLFEVLVCALDGSMNDKFTIGKIVQIPRHADILHGVVILPL